MRTLARIGLRTRRGGPISYLAVILPRRVWTPTFLSSSATITPPMRWPSLRTIVSSAAARGAASTAASRGEYRRILLRKPKNVTSAR